MSTSADSTRQVGGDLLREAASYVPAPNATLTFRELVQDRCTAVTRGHLREYAEIVGEPLDPDRVLAFHYPTDRDRVWKGDYASIGCQIKRAAQVGSWRLYHTLEFELEGNGACTMSVMCSIWFKDRDRVDRIRSALTSHPGLPGAAWCDGRAVGIHRALAPDDMPCFEGQLEELLVDWLGFLRAAGGLRAFDGVTEAEGG